MPGAGHRLGRTASRRSQPQRRMPQQFEMLNVRMNGRFLLCAVCGCNDVCYEVNISLRTRMTFFPRTLSKQKFTSQADDKK